MWLVFAAGAACCFGLRGILYQWTSRQPAERNTLLLGVYLCGAVISVILNAMLGQAWTSGAWAGVAMGFFSFVSNSAMHKGFAVGKASLVALLAGLPPLVVVLGALLLWGERLSLGQAVSFAVILGGGLLIKSAGGLSIRNMNGAQWGLLALVAFALTDLSSKQATLWGGETLPTLVLMYATGSLFFGLSAWAAAVRERHKAQAARASLETAASAGPAGYRSGWEESAVALEETAGGNRTPGWGRSKTMLVGMAVGITNITGMIFMMPAMRTGVTGLVSAIIALNALIIMLYARVVLREKLKPLELAGMAFSFGGVLALRLFG
ncbi:MAG: hypothetical protein K0R57_6575 [Paenibacillaceae bacterium]|nr:hypothetical protein [Paenibacillaceae bacterium]